MLFKHLLCLVENEESVPVILFPLSKIELVWHVHLRIHREHFHLELGLQPHNFFCAPDDHKNRWLFLSPLQLDEVFGNKQNHNGLPLSWRSNLNGDILTFKRFGRHVHLIRSRFVVRVLFCDFVADLNELIVPVSEILVFFVYQRMYLLKERVVVFNL